MGSVRNSKNTLPEDSRGVNQSKRHKYNNKDEDNLPNKVNTENIYNTPSEI